MASNLSRFIRRPAAAFIAKGGDTMMPGGKVAVISNSTSTETRVALSENPDKGSAQSSPPIEKEADKPKTKVEIANEEKQEEPSASPPEVPASEPQLPPKEMERRYKTGVNRLKILDKVVPMERLRKRMATRLKDSDKTFAMLTTFNEVGI